LAGLLPARFCAKNTCARFCVDAKSVGTLADCEWRAAAPGGLPRAPGPFSHRFLGDWVNGPVERRVTDGPIEPVRRGCRRPIMEGYGILCTGSQKRWVHTSEGILPDPVLAPDCTFWSVASPSEFSPKFFGHVCRMPEHRAQTRRNTANQMNCD